MKCFESIVDFYEQCLNCESVQDVADSFKIGRRTVNRYLNKLQECDAEKYNHLKEVWRAKDYVRRQKRAESVEIPYRPKCSFNDHAFDELTPEVAYWLGFIASDGSVHKNRNTLTIGLQQQDKAHLESFLKFLNYSGDVKIRDAKLNNKRFPIAYVNINSKYIKKQLATYGIVPTKSNLDIDYLSYISDKCKLYFIFGYLDGDGHISSINTKSSSLTINILGNKKFINSIDEVMRNKFYFNGKIYQSNHNGTIKYTYVISTTSQCLQFLSKYIDCPYVLQRKLQKAKEWQYYYQNKTVPERFACKS